MYILYISFVERKLKAKKKTQALSYTTSKSTKEAKNSSKKTEKYHDKTLSCKAAKRNPTRRSFCASFGRKIENGKKKLKTKEKNAFIIN